MANLTKQLVVQSLMCWSPIRPSQSCRRLTSFNFSRQQTSLVAGSTHSNSSKYIEIRLSLPRGILFADLLRDCCVQIFRNMSTYDIGGMRIDYKDKKDAFLEKHLVSKEPFAQFKSWFEDACAKKEILEPNAMCLVTATKDGFPSARFVLLKSYGKEGFKFFTNYESRKAKEMAENPNVAATFYWEYLNRSIRIEGHVEKTSEEESKKYFYSRPVASQIAASASHQSTPIESRDVLSEQYQVLEAEYGTNVPKPNHWGGYLIIPRAIEFWQGQRDRLSDRIRFRRPKSGEVPDGKLLHQGEDGWVYERLSP